LQKKYIPCTLHDSLPLWQHQKDKRTEIETIIHIIINHSQRNQPSAKHSKQSKSKIVFINDQSIHRKIAKKRNKQQVQNRNIKNQIQNKSNAESSKYQGN